MVESLSPDAFRSKPEAGAGRKVSAEQKCLGSVLRELIHTLWPVLHRKGDLGDLMAPSNLNI